MARREHILGHENFIKYWIIIIIFVVFYAIFGKMIADIGEKPVIGFLV